MAASEPSLFRQINVQLGELRNAILAGDLVAIEHCTADVSTSLSALRQVLNSNQPLIPTCERNTVRQTARSTLSLLVSAKKTLRALSAVYLSVSPAERRCSPEVF